MTPTSYYKTFYQEFTDSEKTLFLHCCIEMQKMIVAYLSSLKAAARKNCKANDDIRIIEGTLEKMRREMVMHDIEQKLDFIRGDRL